MSNRRIIVHDAQADAMPCECPSCVAARRFNAQPLRLVLPPRDFNEPRADRAVVLA